MAGKDFCLCNVVESVTGVCSPLKLQFSCCCVFRVAVCGVVVIVVGVPDVWLFISFVVILFILFINKRCCLLSWLCVK